MKSQELSEFFSLIGQAKKEKEEEFDNLLKEANVDLDSMATSLFTGIENAKVEAKKQKKKEEKLKKMKNNQQKHKNTDTEKRRLSKRKT